jgi:hypothetical protein
LYLEFYNIMMGVIHVFRPPIAADQKMLGYEFSLDRYCEHGILLGIIVQLPLWLKLG